MVILASGSPRRRELLAREGLEFEVIPSQAEEHPAGALPAVQLAEENALLKAAEVAAQYPDRIVLGADTVVVIDEQTLGKPVDLCQGAEMLRQLSNRWHQVVTGVAIITAGERLVFHEITDVLFKELSDVDIADYHARVEVLDKAGGYAIQDGGERIIAEVRGCRDNVMGLPVEKVIKELTQLVLPND